MRTFLELSNIKYKKKVINLKKKKKKSQQTKIMKIHKNRRNGASGESKERGGGEREERSGVFHFVHCRGTQFRSLLWVLFFRWPTASRRGVYAPRQTVAR